MDNGRKEAQLARASERLAEDAFFLSSALRAFRADRGLSEAGLAAYLGAEERQMARLALCRRPDTQSQAFRAQVEQVARYAGVDALKLGALLLEVAAVETLAGGADADVLLAARDHPGGEEDV